MCKAAVLLVDERHPWLAHCILTRLARLATVHSPTLHAHCTARIVQYCIARMNKVELATGPTSILRPREEG